MEQIKACENLSRYTNNKSDSLALEREISELKSACLLYTSPSTRDRS